MTDASGEITLARAYEPFGEVLTSAGSGTSSYGFTGEWTDGTGLVNLRVRYYAPSQGRFLTRDIWPGNNNLPMSLNKWLYGYANPINFTDPSGKQPSYPSWCEDRVDEALCYSEWIINSGGKLHSENLKAVYDYNPEKTLALLKKAFKIQLPPRAIFRFAYKGHGFFDVPDEIIEGHTAWFFVERQAGNDIAFWILEYNSCKGVNSNIPTTLRYWDDSIYITDEAFTRYNFYPDDIASIMLHEAVHAWQESLAIQQVGNAATTTKWLELYENGLNRQAFDMEMFFHGSRTKLSNTRLKIIQEFRKNIVLGRNSPIVLPQGVP